MASPVLSASARQRASTRSTLIDAAFSVFREEPAAPLTHERVAQRTGIAARTVYRHFPTRADLLTALWERVRDETGTRWPTREDEITPFLRRQFRQFEAHETFVRATIAAAVSAATHTAAGASEGRAAFRQALAGINAGLTKRQSERLVAVCLSIYSAPFWVMLRDRGQLSASEAREAAAATLECVLTAARARAASLRLKNEKL